VLGIVWDHDKGCSLEQWKHAGSEKGGGAKGETRGGSLEEKKNGKLRQERGGRLIQRLSTGIVTKRIPNCYG